MNQDKAIQIAVELQKLGVSQAGVTELLSGYDFDLIERQLSYLPYRKAKRPEAFIIDAVRNNYSPPKELFYAKAKAQPNEPSIPVDQNTELPSGPIASQAQGYGTESAPSADPSDLGLEPGGQVCNLVIPGVEETNGQAE